MSMSSNSFDELRNQHVGVDAGYADDMELPSRLAQQRRRDEDRTEQREEAHEVAAEPVEAEREAVGTHGGSSGSGGEQAAASTPDAMPQRDEPDEGEHSSSRAEPEPEPPVEEEVPDEDLQTTEPEEDDSDPVAEEAAEAQEALEQPTFRLTAPRLPEGAEPLVWKTNLGFGYDGIKEKKKSVYLRAFPVDLVNVLREQLAPFDEEFAREASAPLLVTAFVLARLGLTLPGLDENTRQATRAFAQLSPELASLEQRVDDVGAGMVEVLRVLQGLRRDVDAVGEVARTVEMTNAYVLTDRYEQVAPPQATAKDVELRHPKVLSTRMNLAKQVRAQHKLEVQRQGSPKR